MKTYNKFDTLETSATFIGMLKNENELSWSVFYRNYAKLILNFALKRGCSRELAEDVLQETVMALFRYLRGFDYDKKKGKFRSLLFKITESKVVDAFRKNKISTVFDEKQLANKSGDDADSLGGIPQIEELWDQAWDEELLQNAVEEAKQRVKPKTFECFKRVFIEGQAVGETADKMGISPNLVSQHKYKVMSIVIDSAKKMRRLLGE
ncbi:MAG: hypothetical protein A2020_13385 [Lentisphaerae bacterium GWF2_45_14]|nr:MAG: hypothetical protein A2020_13385 [Lentisphaerae bacterium GWF2_45_14]